MKDFLVIKDPQVAKLFADPIRRSILHNLRRREMPPSQLAKVLDKNVSSISYHLDALEKAGLVELSRTKVRGNLIEKFYRATARVFVISYTLSEGIVPGSEDVAKWSREVCRNAASNLTAFGYRIPAGEVDEWMELIERYASLEKATYEEIIARQTSPTHLERPALKLIVGILTHVRLKKKPEFVGLMDKISGKLSGMDEK